ncbi:MAG: CYTH domain-containing protein [Flavobacteriales bacterium]|nr:CYTH domain-containing protein [Flavobacteriales bacterium]
MGIEIERKFLLANSNWKQLADGGTAIKQGYLSSDINKTIRIRIYGGKGFITIKGKTIGISRPEFEYEIPLKDALQLIKLCEKPFIEKIRYLVHLNGNIWEIDVFEGANEGLIVAEIELPEENLKIIVPDWIGIEVSDQVKYFNSNLIRHPYREWT